MTDTKPTSSTDPPHSEDPFFTGTREHVHRYAVETPDAAKVRWDAESLSDDQRKLLGVCHECGEVRSYDAVGDPFEPTKRRRRGRGTAAGRRIRSGLRRKSLAEREQSGGGRGTKDPQLEKRLTVSEEFAPLPRIPERALSRLKKLKLPPAKRCQRELLWHQKKQENEKRQRVKVPAPRGTLCGHPLRQHRDGKCVECSYWNQHHRFAADPTPRVHIHRDASPLSEQKRKAIAAAMRRAVHANNGGAS